MATPIREIYTVTDGWWDYLHSQLNQSSSQSTAAVAASCRRTAILQPCPSRRTVSLMCLFPWGLQQLYGWKRWKCHRIKQVKYSLASCYYVFHASFSSITSAASTLVFLESFFPQFFFWPFHQQRRATGQRNPDISAVSSAKFPYSSFLVYHFSYLLTNVITR